MEKGFLDCQKQSVSRPRQDDDDDATGFFESLVLLVEIGCRRTKDTNTDDDNDDTMMMIWKEGDGERIKTSIRVGTAECAGRG